MKLLAVLFDMPPVLEGAAFAALSVFFFAWLVVSIYPSEVRVPFAPALAGQPWAARAAGAVQAFAVRGLALGGGNAHVPYEVLRGEDHRPDCDPGNGDNHIQFVRTATAKFALKIPKFPVGPDAAAYREIEELRVLYPALGEYLCPAKLLPRALPVADEDGLKARRDVIVMDFQKPSLLHFICESLRSDKPEKKLRPLAGNFRRMVRGFHQAGYIFGDYNNMNMTVREVGGTFRPVLIDLDTFSHRDRPQNAFSFEGQAGFQPLYRLDKGSGLFAAHPERLDYFSEWIIYTSLMAYAIMADAFDEPVREAPLFGWNYLEREHLRDPENPLSKLLASEHRLLVEMATRISAVCAADYDPNLLIPLEEIFTDQQYAEWENDAKPGFRRMYKQIRNW